MKWMIALLLSVGMFYLGYHHAERYVRDDDRPPPKTGADGGQDPSPPPAIKPAPAPVEPVEPVAEMAPAGPAAIGEEPVEPSLDSVPASVPELRPDPSLVSENAPAGGLEGIDLHTAESRDRSDSPILERGLSAALVSGDWTGYRDQLRQAINPFALERARSSRDLDELLDGQLFRRMHSQERFLTRFGQEVVQEPFKDQAFARWLLGNEDAMLSAYDQITEQDEPAAVINLLSDLYQEVREDLLSYTRLAIACALVYDSKPGAAINRFFWYVKQDKADRLYRDPKKMPVHDLCFVVGGIDLKELEWVQDDYRRNAPRSGTGKVYSNIEYRMDFVTGETKRSDVYKDYTLAEIAEHGGICGDQTYFATHVCRSLGIPAVGLSGSGDRGAHAWVGYQNDDGTWTTHGRYEDYANGSFNDPQTKRRAIESELALRSEPEFRSAARLDSLRDNFRIVAQLTDAGNLARATELSQSLLVSNRAYVPGWEKLFEIYGKRRAELTGDGPLTKEEVVATIRDYEIALKEFPDLLERADGTLTSTLDGIVDAETQLKIIKRRRNRVESIDEGRLLAILELIRQEAKIYAKAGDYDAITALYRRELRTGADDVQHFMKLAADYWKTSKGHPDREKAALQLISSRVKSNFGDNLKSSDWFTKETALKPHAQLVKFYRESGENGRADSLERELDRVRRDLRETNS